MNFNERLEKENNNIVVVSGLFNIDLAYISYKKRETYIQHAQSY